MYIVKDGGQINKIKMDWKKRTKSCDITFRTNFL
jgi:hypothetical protein